MTMEGGADTKASEHLFAYVSNVRALGFLEAPQRRHARVPIGAINHGDTSAGAIERIIHRNTERGDFVWNAIAVCINKVRAPIFFFAVVVHSAFALGRPHFVCLEAVLDGPQLKIILKPELGGAIVFDTLPLPKGLRDEERAVVRDAEGDGVLDERVLGEEGPGEARRGRWRERRVAGWR
jgi:hypothetical protein